MPICLLNVSYKIITKALMLRFKDCMSRIVNKSQNAFIKGRHIMDGVLCLHEILHDTKIWKKDGIILELDFEKAYDELIWAFFMKLWNKGDLAKLGVNRLKRSCVVEHSVLKQMMKLGGILKAKGG
jgi:hypothetical protein